MLDRIQLETLAAVLRAGSFEAAAARLGVTPSAVSQRIRALEERIGAPLIRRGQPAEATLPGARLLAHAEALALMEAELVSGLGLAAPEAPQPALLPVRLAVNADSLATWVIPALAEAGGLLYDIEIDDQDHASDWLRQGLVAAAVTASAAPVQGCTALALGSLVYRAVAAPGFVQRWFSGGITAQTLVAAPMLRFDGRDQLQHRWAEALTGQVLNAPEHRIASTHAFTEAALAGLGWALNPAALVDAHLRSGALVDLSPGRPQLVPLIWQVPRLGAGRLAPLTAAIRRQARASLVQG